MAEKETLIYSNPLASPADMAGFVMEGSACVTFENGRMRMRNQLDPSLGQQSNFVYWCPRIFPSDIRVEWDFRPLREPGLCILFFAAAGRGGEDLFDPALAPRAGVYDSYHHGDINAYHLSYFRRKESEERAFHTCNLRKSYGFELVSQGADPIPSVEDVTGPYHLTLCKRGGTISFAVNGLTVLQWSDPGRTPVLGGGRIGFRQMAPLCAEYSALKVYGLEG